MLTNLKCSNAKPKQKPYKLADSGGLYLLVNPNGSKLWRIKYRYLGKEKSLSPGPYPLISIAEAREKRDEAKKSRLNGIDPMTDKKQIKRRAIRNAQNTFQAVALEWHQKKRENWSINYSLNMMRRLEIDIFPYIGARPIAEIDPPELLENVLRRIEKRGSLEVVAKVKCISGMVFQYGIATGKCPRNPASDLKGALAVHKTKHYPALQIEEIPEFLTALKENKARIYPRTERAIRLLMLTFVRTSELIKAKWSEFDLENAQWLIPAERMKMGNPHIVPLSRQALTLLAEQKEETGGLNTEYVLPGFVNHKKPLSDNTILSAIGNLGFKGRMTGHGFRALAMSTIKEQLGYRHEVADRQLAHAHKSKIDRAYDRAQFLDERQEMMQEYANYIEAIASGKKVAGKIKSSKQGERHAT